MAIGQPSLYPINAFDAAQAFTVSFSVNASSDQVVKNRLVITSSSNSSIIYDKTVNNFLLQHTIPANTLNNGQSYTAVVYAYNAIGNQSTASSSVAFSCWKTPTIEFSNIEENAIIRDSSYTFGFIYNQSQGRSLNNYNIILYDASMVKVRESGNIYTNSNTVPFEGNYRFSGLLDSTAYKIQVTGYTVDGMETATNILSFVVAYDQTELHTQLNLTTNCQEGYVIVQSGILSINGITKWDPKYIDGAMIDLTDGNSVTWNKGFVVNGNFTLGAWGQQFIPGKIITLKNSVGEDIKIEFYDTYIVLRVTPGYVIISNKLSRKPYANEKVHIWVRRIKNLYDIKIKNLG